MDLIEKMLIYDPHRRLTLGKGYLQTRKEMAIRTKVEAICKPEREMAIHTTFPLQPKPLERAIFNPKREMTIHTPFSLQLKPLGTRSSHQ